MTFETITKNPKTTLGGIVALTAVGLLIAHRIDVTQTVMLLGVAGGWLGIVGKDASTGSSKPTPVADHAIDVVTVNEASGVLLPSTKETEL